MMGEEEERQEASLRQAFSLAVEAAAELAAQKVAAVHRRRLVRWTASATAIVMLAIFTPVAIVLYDNARAAARSSALYDCRLFTRAAGLLGAYVDSDAQLRLLQARESIAGPLLHDFAKIIPVRQLLALSAKSRAQGVAAAHRWQRDADALVHIAGTDCVRKLGG